MLYEYSFGEIYIRHAVDDIPNDLNFKMHIHEQCEIYFFISGNVEYLVEGSKYPLDENSLMIMRPAESHKAKITGTDRYERYAINFPVAFADDIDPNKSLIKVFIERSLGQNNLLRASEIDVRLVNKLFSEMCRENDEYHKQLTIRTHLLMLLDMINRAYCDRGQATHKPQSANERMVMYVNDHLFEDLSVSTLAKHFYLSPSQFGRAFRQATGAAPWEYILQKRLTAAKEKIRSGCSAQKACDECGFGDYSAFYRAFIKHFGYAPKESFGNTK